MLCDRTRMKIRRALSATLLCVAAILTLPLTASTAQASATQIACLGPVGCAGQDPYASGCADGAVLIEDQSVPHTGDIDLYESPSCHTAWATLGGSICSAAGTCLNQQAAEIFYIPPQGGSEQYQAVLWEGDPNASSETLMVPDNGSVKACGGNPAGGVAVAAEAFDLNPQGQQNPMGNRATAITSQTKDEFPSGACTLWH